MRSKFVYAAPSLVLALAAIGLALYGLMQSPETPVATPSAEQAPAQAVEEKEAAPVFRYLVAIEDLEAGTVLAQEQFQEFELSAALENALPPDQAPFGTSLNRPLKAGMVLSQASIDAGTPLQLSLADGARAMAFELNALSSIGGLIQPGDQVDIYGTFKGTGGIDTGTTRLMRNVEVLAVRGALEPGSDASDDAQRRNQTMVLSVPQAEVARLVLAASESRLSFVAARPELKATGEEALDDIAGKAVEEQQISLLTDIRPSAKPRPAPAQQPRQAPARNPGQEVKIYEGSGTRSVYVR
ncbi:MAG: Flp pilus assembly protein CpaB [Marinobacter sp.]|uniref:Flp pilus assembly protein CpaB n=1 Tax=Marinobacter sp. TaxID=50741 RepID=UPI0029C1E7CB|nr:Flp pilus assembly protein CpaB [Marinobacter sp.]MDX5335536.1 Flp pilus assembly protein CpaB [Marinobacter sp.]MDX5386404.1 Flp pilus assembly protein CpaB [Marinobacter sp.]MDX5439047.1 Flp pilus assembly protein CpaB [Alteromonadaceae bacterium]MDX5471873.1 Flp pilus assembly protein CpaB [Marinobacter sp.]